MNNFCVQNRDYNIFSIKNKACPYPSKIHFFIPKLKNKNKDILVILLNFSRIYLSVFVYQDHIIRSCNPVGDTEYCQLHSELSGQ